MKPRCVVLGGGGHAKVVLQTLKAEGRYAPAAVTDRRRSGPPVLGVRIAGDDDVLPALKSSGIRYFIVGVGGVPDNRPRARLYETGRSSGLRPLTCVHPSASVADTARLGPGTIVMPGAVVNADAIIGSNVILNSGSIVEHDARIADHVHVCPGACVSGSVEIGEGAFIGAGAVLIEGVRIGAWAVVGAGAVVLAGVPPGVRAVGVPAQVLSKKHKR